MNFIKILREAVKNKLDKPGQEDKDINNDNKVDKTDKFLAARRKAISSAIAKKKGKKMPLKKGKLKKGK
jgi:hypothetical protein